MKYTFSGQGDKKVEKDMRIICEEVLEEIKDVDSILLTGGFARGEGPVKVEKKRVFPYNDYDIQIISRVKLTKEGIDKISDEISRKLGYKGIVNFYPFRKEEQKIRGNFYIDLKCDTPGEVKKLLPRIRTYELRNHSKVLYERKYGGWNKLKELIPDYNLKDIPLAEGAKLLLDRMSQMIEYYSTEKKYEREFLTYIIQQAYAACCTSLLLLNGKYQIGYKKSMEIFKRTYKQDFPKLYIKIPNLAEKIEQFILWKINPKELPNENVEEEWFIAKKNISEVSRYFFSKFCEKEINNLEDLAHAILKMRKEFYAPYLREVIKNKIGFKLPVLFLLPVVSLFFKFKYYKRLKESGINYSKLFLYPPSDLIIFSSLIYFIEAINKGGVNEKILKEGWRLLKKVYPSKGKNWEEISLDYANAYIAFFLQKI